VNKRLSYRQIAADLLARIGAGEYPPGAAIPSYRQLSRTYGVSMGTAQSAVRLLRLLGVLYGVAGRGVFVSRPPARSTRVVVPDAAALAGQLPRRTGLAVARVARRFAVADVVPAARRPSPGS